MGTATLRYDTDVDTVIPLQPRPNKVVQTFSSCRAVAEVEVVAVEVEERWVGLQQVPEDPVYVVTVGTTHLI